MTDEIEMAPYRPEWKALFEAERAALKNVLPADLVLDVEHFGSTAIAGMPAKPIIDILVAVRSVPTARELFPAILERLEYDFWADNPKLDRLFFVKGMPPRGERRTHHVHVSERPGEMWDRILFRDYLIANPSAAAEYAQLKQRLARAFRDDREGYTRAKDGFIAKVMAAARAVRSSEFQSN